jgi:hypothetical protein
VIIKSSSFMLNKSSHVLNKYAAQLFILFLDMISAYLYYDASSNHTLFLDGFSFVYNFLCIQFLVTSLHLCSTISLRSKILFYFRRVCLLPSCICMSNIKCSLCLVLLQHAPYILYLPPCPLPSFYYF